MRMAREALFSPTRWIFFFLTALATAYLFAFILLPTTFSRQLMAHFNVPKVTLSYAMTSYAYSLTLFLIPVSLLIDRYFQLWIFAAGLILTGLGALLFAHSSEIIHATLARAFMGLGATVGLTYSIKALSAWVGQSRRACFLALFIALQIALTLAIAWISHLLFQKNSWQKMLHFYGLCSFPLALLCLLFYRSTQNFPFQAPPLPSSEWWRAIRSLFDSSQVWFIGFATGIFLGVFLTFISKWGLPFFCLAYKLSFQQALCLVALVCLGFLAGAFFFSSMSTSLQKRKMFIPWGILISLLMLIIMIYPPYLPFQPMLLICFLCGFAGASGLLGYVVICEQNPFELTATAFASIYTFFGFAIIFTDPLISVFLEFESITAATPVATLRNFQIALFRMPIYIALSLLFSLFIRDTHAKQTNLGAVTR